MQTLGHLSVNIPGQSSAGFVGSMIEEENKKLLKGKIGLDLKNKNTF